MSEREQDEDEVTGLMDELLNVIMASNARHTQIIEALTWTLGVYVGGLIETETSNYHSVAKTLAQRIVDIATNSPPAPLKPS
jgi:hypothetical protein